jgi:hypothetical protein
MRVPPPLRATTETQTYPFLTSHQLHKSRLSAKSADCVKALLEFFADEAEHVACSAWGGIGRRPMRVARLALVLACFGWPIVATAQDAADINKIADMMVRLCVGGGRTEAMSGGGAGGADLSLRSLDVTGHLKGEFKVSKASAEGLVNGIDNALSQVAAGQADKVRACLQPVRERLLDVMLPPKSQGSAGQTVTAPGGIAVGRDVKNSPITISPPPSPGK